MKKYLVLAMAIALSGCATFDWSGIRALVKVGDQEAVSDIDRALVQGRVQFVQGNYGIAIDSFNAAVTLDPKSVRALNGLAASYDKLGRFDLAQRYYANALALDPESPMTLNNIGYSQLLQGNLKEALNMFETAARFDPENKQIAANSDLAVAMIGYDARRAPHGEVAVTQLAQVEAPKMWIEKTAERVYTLVTRPDPEFLERAEQLKVDPRLVSLSGAREK